MAVNTAPVKWAQRADSIYLTLDLPDVKDEQLKLTKDMLSFRQDYNCKIVCSACFCSVPLPSRLSSEVPRCLGSSVPELSCARV